MFNIPFRPTEIFVRGALKPPAIFARRTSLVSIDARMLIWSIESGSYSIRPPLTTNESLSLENCFKTLAASTGSDSITATPVGPEKCSRIDS